MFLKELGSLRMKKKKKILFPLLIIIIFITLFFKVGILNISKIDVQINNAPCISEQNIKLESQFLNKNILLADENNVKRRILQKYFCVKNIQVKKEFPKTVKIIIDGRAPLTRVFTFKYEKSIRVSDLEATPSSSAAILDWSFPNPIPEYAFIADDTGLIFEKDNKGNLPALFLSEDIKIGQQLNNLFFNRISEIIIKLTKLEVLVLQAKVIDNSLLVEAQEKIVFSLNKDIFKQLASLQLILQKAKIDGKIMEIIDLRFDKPIIVYSNKK